MGWTDWFARRGAHDDIRPSLRDVTFDTGGNRVLSKTPSSIEWQARNDDRVIARIDRASADRPLIPWTLDALRGEWRRAAAERSGGIVCVTFDRANGIPIARTITKFRHGMGYLYEGTVLVRFRDAQYSVTMRADEGRSTGTREAMVTALLVQIGELQLPVVKPPAVSATLEGWMRDPYDDNYDGPTEHTTSDDERLDELLPDHPLSRVRRWLALVKDTLRVASDLQHDLVEPPTAESATSESRHRMSALAIGILFMQAGRPDLAEQHMSAALPMRDGEPILDARRIGGTLMMLGVTREALGRFEDAAWAHERALRAMSATGRDDDPALVRARGNLGRVYAVLGRPADAEPLLAAAIPVFESSGNTSELAVAMNALGIVRQSQTRHAEAIVCFERALKLFETLHGPNYADCADVLNNLAKSAEATGDRVGSARARKRAQGIRWTQSMTRH